MTERPAIERFRGREYLTRALDELTLLVDVLGVYDADDQTPGDRQKARELHRKARELRDGVQSFLHHRDTKKVRLP